MAFIRKNFSLISSGFSGVTPKQWAYSTFDDVGLLLQIGAMISTYFKDAKDLLSDGDLITVRFDNDFGAPGNIPSVATLKVSLNDPNSDNIFITLQGPWTLNVLIPDISTAQTVFIPIMPEIQVIAYTAVLDATTSVAPANLSLETFTGVIAGSNIVIPANSIASESFSKFMDNDVSRVVQPDTTVFVKTDGGSTGVVSANITLIGL